MPFLIWRHAIFTGKGIYILTTYRTKHTLIGTLSLFHWYEKKEASTGWILHPLFNHINTLSIKKKKSFNFLYYTFACIIKNILYLCTRFHVFFERLSSRRAKLAIIVYNENHDGEDGTNLESRHNGKAFIRRFIFDSKKSNGRCPRDVYIHVSYWIWLAIIGSISVRGRYIISAWALTLFILTGLGSARAS